MQPQERIDHRARIAFDVEVILSGYWRDFPPDQVKAAILADWCDELEDWTQAQILYALRKWRKDNPDKRPNPGHIRAILIELRGKAEAARAAKEPPAPPRVLPPAEERREIVKRVSEQVGYALKTFGSDQ
jgi:hypothetical protein